MALPCSVGPHPFLGAKINAYVRRGRGLEMSKHLSRLCPDHWQLAERYLAKFEVDPEDAAISTFDSAVECFACGNPLSEVWEQLFVTCFPTKNERKDYWAKVHVTCGTPAELAGVARYLT